MVHLLELYESEHSEPFNLWPRLDNLVCEALVVPLTVVMLDVLRDRSMQRVHAEEDRPVKARGLDRRHPASANALALGAVIGQRRDRTPAS